MKTEETGRGGWRQGEGEGDRDRREGESERG